jgi:hypothetical protein
MLVRQRLTSGLLRPIGPKIRLQLAAIMTNSLLIKEENHALER